MKLILFGASGTGTTTLGKSIAEKLNWIHLDADDYYWEITQPPFQKKVPLSKRNENLKADFTKHKNIVISGSLVTWSEYWNTAFDLGVFLRLPKQIRMKRLLAREIERYGKALNTNPEIKAKSKAFLEWAAKYDDKTFDGRSISQHRNWIKLLTCEMIELNGDLTNDDRLNAVIQKCNQLVISFQSIRH